MNGNIIRIIRKLTKGFPVCFPTDTVIAIAADPKNQLALKKIYAIKKRTENQPMAILVKNTEQIHEFTDINEHELKLIQKINKAFPGQITFVLPSRANYFADLVINSRGAMGLRIPQHRLTQKILSKFGSPLAATSLNLSGQPVASTRREASQILADTRVLMADCNYKAPGVASTVVDFTDFAKPIVLRVGLVTEPQFRQVLDSAL